MLFWAALILTTLLLLAATAVVLVENLLVVVVAWSVVAMCLTLFFVLLQAPDVALVEGIVGVGLITLLLALTLQRIKVWQIGNPNKN